MRVRLLLATMLLSVACSQGTGAQGDKPATGAQPAKPADPQTVKESAPAKESAPEAVKGTSGGPAVNADAAVLKDFGDRIAAYMAIHKDAAGDGAKLKESSDPAKIMAAQDGMAARIRAARANAKPGDIFTPAVREQFRRLMYPQFKGEDGRDAKAVIRDDAPPVSPLLKINSKYAAESFPSVPSKVLLNLPRLPNELEYRIVDGHLILLDVDANIIVDYMANIIR
jgi:hypothetical protein